MGFWIFGKKKDDEIKRLKENLKGSFLNIKGDIDNTNKFLNYLKKKDTQYEEKIDVHEQRLGKIEEEIIKIRDILYEKKRREVKRSIVHEHVQSFNRSNQSFMNVQSLKGLKEKLTPAQKRVIQVLNITEIPLEYEDISRELKLNVITVRRHINDIKRTGFQIKEKINVDTGRKVFYIEKAVKKAISNKKRILR